MKSVYTYEFAMGVMINTPNHTDEYNPMYAGMWDDMRVRISEVVAPVHWAILNKLRYELVVNRVVRAL